MAVFCEVPDPLGLVCNTAGLGLAGEISGDTKLVPSHLTLIKTWALPDPCRNNMRSKVNVIAMDFDISKPSPFLFLSFVLSSWLEDSLELVPFYCRWVQQPP